jgi:uncharacterized membrane protein YphA (DoxX/SURF4 family)
MIALRGAAIVVRILLGILFIYASYPKILDPAGFSRTVYYYRLLPPAAVNLVAIVLPWIEILVGALLVIGFKVRGAALVATTSLLVFAAAMTSAYVRGLNIDCGCFSSTGGHGIDARRILEDVVLVGAAAFVYWAAATTSRLKANATSPIKEKS